MHADAPSPNLPSNAPAVEWQAANLHPCAGSGATVKAWQLRVNGRVVLNAVSMSDLHEAVTMDDRKMIGQALAEYLANAGAVTPGETETPLR
jgi:hypothetical protein